MVFTAVLVFGTISLLRLKVDLLPDISFPSVTVITVYDNVSPEEIETLVTKPVEEIVASVEGVNRVTSETIEGVSIVTVRFGWGRKMDDALIQTREKVDLVKASLPQDVKRPIVLPFDPNDTPILRLAVRPVGVPFKELRSYLKKNIEPLLEKTDGIAALSVSGGYERQVLVHIDRGKLDAYGLGFNQIISRIGASNYNFPAGNIKRGDKEILVRTVGEFRDMATIANTVIGVTEGGVPVYLRNVGDVRDDYKERTSVSYYGTEECVSLLLKKEAGKNTVAVAERARESIADINARFAEDVRLDIVSDQSEFIREAIENVASSAILAAVICYFVLFYFIGSYRPPLVVVSAVPISIMATFLLMYARGFTLNTMSLGGLAVGVGMMVDSATVVLEAIYVKRREDPDALRSALVGTREVAGSVFSSTLTSIVVFLPVVFVEGIAGAVFQELALTITFALISSLLVSLTLIPAMTMLPVFRRLPPEDDAPVADGTFFGPAKVLRNKSLSAIETFYDRLLRASFRSRGLLWAASAALFGVSIFLFWYLPSEIMPDVDRGEFLLKFETPEGTNLPVSAVLAEELSAVLRQDEDVVVAFARIGYEERDIQINPSGDFGLNRGEILIRLRPGTDTARFIDRYREPLTRVGEQEEAELTFVESGSLLAEVLSGGDYDYNVEISGPNIETIEDITRAVRRELAAFPELKEVSTSFDEETPEYRVELDRDRMSLYGLTVQDVALTLRAALKGETATRYRENDEEIDVLVRLREGDRRGLDALRELPVQTQNGNVKLPSFASLRSGSSPRKIVRTDARRIGLVYINFAESLRYSQAQTIIEPVLREYEQKHPEYAVLPGEMSRQSAESFTALAMAGLLAVVLVYMVLAAQFENYLLPVIVMLSIVVVGLGSGILLLASGNTINIISLTGMVMLAGLVVNNAIVLIEYFNQNIGTIHDLEELALAGVKRRIRPILNTTATTILGLIPLAFSVSGASPQAPMAVAVIGGLAVSTLFTLILIPNAYIVLYRNRPAPGEAAAQVTPESSGAALKSERLSLREADEGRL